MCSQWSRFDASHLSCNPSTTLYMTRQMALICWSGPIFRILKLWELEVSQLGFKSWRDFFWGKFKWYVRQDLEAQRWSDYSLRWLQSLTRQSHPWLALSPIYCIQLPSRIDQPDAQHSLLVPASAAQRNATVSLVNLNQSCTYSHNISHFSHPTVYWLSA